MENHNVYPNNNSGKIPAQNTKAPWWLAYVIGILIPLGIWVKSIISDARQDQKDNFDKLLQQNNKMIEVVSRSNILMSDFLRLMQEHTKTTSNEIIASDSTYFWRTDHTKDGSTR